MSKTLESICDRFNRLNWHDSKLLDIQILRSKDGLTDEGCFGIKLLTNPVPGNYKWTNAKLIMKDCTIIKLDLDLTFKREASDDINEAYCEIESELKKHIENIQLKYEKNPLAEYLHFRILMCPPGGEINIFAKDFELIMGEEKEQVTLLNAPSSPSSPSPQPP